MNKICNIIHRLPVSGAVQHERFDGAMSRQLVRIVQQTPKLRHLGTSARPKPDRTLLWHAICVFLIRNSMHKLRPYSYAFY